MWGGWQEYRGREDNYHTGHSEFRSQNWKERRKINKINIKKIIF